jgi:hypothetical protein
MLMSISSKERQGPPMTSDASCTADPTDLLELARTVERCVPNDVETARACLRALRDAIGVQRGEPEGDAARLRSLVARIAHDLDGGHVLAVSGLERQLKHSLEQASGLTATLLS